VNRHGYGFISRVAARLDRARNVASRPERSKKLKRSRLHILYAGRVQGVGFRYTAKRAALEFEITGTVKNLPDGRVELVAEGERTELEAFAEAVRDSGLAGFIRAEDRAWREATNEFRGFEIIS